ncbi:MAG: hypothetical protein AAGE85_10590 [Pseudomonadota bacterium]
MAAGVSCAALGLLPLAKLGLDASVRHALAAAWLVCCGLDLLRRVRQFGRVGGYRLSAELALEVRSSDGRLSAARILDGSVALGNLIWLRYRDGRGRAAAELLLGDRRRSANWRRFQVILRQAEPARKR